MNIKKHYVILFGLFFLVTVGCGGSGGSSKKSNNTKELVFSEARFSNPTHIDNNYFPLKAEQVQIYQTEADDEIETSVTTLSDETKIIAGIQCVVFNDSVYEDDLLVEVAYEYYAQDDNGNVWYMGESVVEYEYDDDENLLDIESKIEWETGVDNKETGKNAEPGVVMKAVPAVGDKYRIVFYEGEEEDLAEVLETDATITLEDGSVYEHCLKIKETDNLDDKADEDNYYAPGIGFIKVIDNEDDEITEVVGMFDTGSASLPDFASARFTSPTQIDNSFFPQSVGAIRTYREETEDGTEIIEIEVMDETRVVAGIDCSVIRDRVYLDDVIIEDTYDWFAQDDTGNVWYMGEEVVNYDYDDEGNLIDTNTEGSWEAGLNGAQAGIQMWTSPVVGSSYYQEYYEDEAEDMGLVVASGVTVSLANGTTYQNCLQTLDWTPLEPSALEYKFYAPGVGFIKELHLGSDESLELESL